jgi:hypothetical protein
MKNVDSLALKDNHKSKLLHSTYFRLRDRSQTSCEKYVAACTKYLSIRKGIAGFWVATLAEDFNRTVNDLNYDVAMHIEFENFAAWDAYSNDPDHAEFVTQVGSAAESRRVFDSYLEENNY